MMRATRRRVLESIAFGFANARRTCKHAVPKEDAAMSRQSGPADMPDDPELLDAEEDLTDSWHYL